MAKQVITGIADSLKLFSVQDAEAMVILLTEDRELFNVIITNHEELRDATVGIKTPYIVLVEKSEKLDVATRKEMLIKPKEVSAHLLDHLLVNEEGKYASAMCTSPSCCPEEGK